ncbi:MAG: galactose-1-phosphate uridylyltransferase [Candidatus Eiseniibacteriota bacterium]
MRELRRDPIVSRWVIFSGGRGRRPSDWDAGPPPTTDRSVCPFCPGREAETPPEILANRAPGSLPNGPGWTLRVVPNKFPALRVEESLETSREGIYERMAGVGAHEVIIESPEHEKDLSELAPAQVERIVAAYRARMLDLQSDARLRYVLVFKNEGPRAGATLAHGHSQLIATPVVPQAVADELQGALEHHRRTGRCAFCDIVEQETRGRVRLVLERDGFVALSPFAARLPFETWILPRRHASSFEDLAESEIAPLAAVMRETLGRIRKALHRPHYNFAIHTAPCREPGLAHYHWHIEITPKRTPAAGFEWGSGFYVNSTTPEEAAEVLRALEA